jgi:hypothetical protein
LLFELAKRQDLAIAPGLTVGDGSDRNALRQF